MHALNLACALATSAVAVSAHDLLTDITKIQGYWGQMTKSHLTRTIRKIISALDLLASLTVVRL